MGCTTDSLNISIWVLIEVCCFLGLKRVVQIMRLWLLRVNSYRHIWIFLPGGELLILFLQSDGRPVRLSLFNLKGRSFRLSFVVNIQFFFLSISRLCLEDHPLTLRRHYRPSRQAVVTLTAISGHSAFSPLASISHNLSVFGYKLVRSASLDVLDASLVVTLISLVFICTSLQAFASQWSNKWIVLFLLTADQATEWINHTWLKDFPLLISLEVIMMKWQRVTTKLGFALVHGRLG